MYGLLQAHPVSHTCGYEFIAVCWLGCCLEVIASWLVKCLYDYVAIMCLICIIAYRALMQIGESCEAMLFACCQVVNVLYCTLLICNVLYCELTLSIGIRMMQHTIQAAYIPAEQFLW